MVKKMSLKQPDIEKAKKKFVDEPETRIIDAEKHTHSTHSAFPWEQPEVSERVISPFNLRLPEPMKLKIEWIVKNSLEYNSMHDFSMKAVTQKIEEELEKLT